MAEDDVLLAEMQTLRDRVMGITGSALASRDGLIIRADTVDVNPDNLAALAAATLSLAQRTAAEAGQGVLQESATYSSGGCVVTYAVGPTALLAVLGDAGLNRARLLQESRSTVETIRQLLAASQRQQPSGRATAAR